MNTKDQPLPTSGGSYIRNADGSLTLEQPAKEVVAVSVVQEPAPEATTAAAKPAKPVKEA